MMLYNFLYILPYQALVFWVILPLQARWKPQAHEWQLGSFWHCFLKEIQPCQNTWDAPVAFISSAMAYEMWDWHWRQLYNVSCKQSGARFRLNEYYHSPWINWQWSFVNIQECYRVVSERIAIFLLGSNSKPWNTHSTVWNLFSDPRFWKLVCKPL